MPEQEIPQDGKPGPCMAGTIAHKFEPRYDEEAPELASDLAQDLDLGSYSNSESVVAIIKSLKKRTYVCDVCTQCGKTTRRPLLTTSVEEPEQPI